MPTNDHARFSKERGGSISKIPLRALEDVQLAGGRGGIKGCSRSRIPAHTRAQIHTHTRIRTVSVS